MESNMAMIKFCIYHRLTVLKQELEYVFDVVLARLHHFTVEAYSPIIRLFWILVAPPHLTQWGPIGGCKTLCSTCSSRPEVGDSLRFKSKAHPVETRTPYLPLRKRRLPALRGRRLSVTLFFPKKKVTTLTVLGAEVYVVSLIFFTDPRVWRFNPPHCPTRELRRPSSLCGTNADTGGLKVSSRHVV
ncbi:hypothetical protein EVAR_41476_1 [Eumeta japonica]|uniref:Uncharacterized protein n=1 Tax=Eumeta variegata TaxID=151549 RepID=A0A4C1X189_EUMVA|nr:hypothetical protein EVAR_41476_1 [Eumeta japonica]